MNNYILCITCPDKKGIIASVANFLSKHNCNIIETSQFGDKNTNMFFMRTIFETQNNEQIIQEITENIKDLALEFSMKWEIHPENKKTRTLILVSKTDHCLNDILYKYKTNHLPIEITAIASNHQNNQHLSESNNIRYEHLPITPDTKIKQENKIRELIKETNSELIIMARYMQILSDELSNEFYGRIINIHHSFLPGFKGAKPYHQAYNRGVKLTGATAHFATADLDEGPIIEQEIARTNHTHTPEEMQVIGRDTEAKVLSRAINYYAERRIFLNQHKTVIL